MTSWPSGIVQVIGEKSRTYENTADAQKGDQRGSFEFRVSVDRLFEVLGLIYYVFTCVNKNSLNI